MDGITLLKADHKSIERLFKSYEKAGDAAVATKRTIVDQIIEGLSTHASVEEQIFYPEVRARVEDTDDIVLESLEEHHLVKILLAELATLEATDEHFDAKVTVLTELVRHHVEEEEQEMFPAVRTALGRKALGEIGERMEAARAAAA